MSLHTFGHLLRTLLGVFLLWLLPWLLILSLAAAVSYFEKRFHREKPPLIHFPGVKRSKAA